MPPVSKIGALRISSPTKWRTAVRKSLKEAKGDLTAAATALGVSRRQLSRWIACSERAKASSSQKARCGACEGCVLVKGLPLGQPGRPWSEAGENE